MQDQYVVFAHWMFTMCRTSAERDWLLVIKIKIETFKITVKLLSRLVLRLLE